MKRTLIFFSILLLINVLPAFAQEPRQEESAKEASVRKMLEAKNYIFKAQFVLPTRGVSRQLTSEYDLKVSKENVEGYLPYFGRAYNAPLNPSEGGIKFTSSDFDYKFKEKKRGGWEITIQPKDLQDVRRLYLSVSASGYASLRVLSNNREPIAFNGYVQNRAK